jgi:ECF sigma factor
VEWRRTTFENVFVGVRQRPGPHLSATALVPEAYLRLVGDQHLTAAGIFFAAEAMRRILIESAHRNHGPPACSAFIAQT